MESLVNTLEGRTVVKRLIKAEMQEHGLRYVDLSNRLADEFGIRQSEANLRQKVSKGTLGAQLFLQLLCVMHSRTLEVTRVKALFEEVGALSEMHTVNHL